MDDAWIEIKHPHQKRHSIDLDTTFLEFWKRYCFFHFIATCKYGDRCKLEHPNKSSKLFFQIRNQIVDPHKFAIIEKLPKICDVVSKEIGQKITKVKMVHCFFSLHGKICKNIEHHRIIKIPFNNEMKYLIFCYQTTEISSETSFKCQLHIDFDIQFNNGHLSLSNFRNCVDLITPQNKYIAKEVEEKAEEEPEESIKKIETEKQIENNLSEEDILVNINLLLAKYHRDKTIQIDNKTTEELKIIIQELIRKYHEIFTQNLLLNYEINTILKLKVPLRKYLPKITYYLELD